MDFIERLVMLAGRVPNAKELASTEEAAKNSLVMPFIQALGYDVFNLNEVIPEYTADFGEKKGEKVDYAILQDGKPIMVVECKPLHDILDQTKSSQLARYFANTEARIAILTNGIEYKFFMDLEKPNIMDDRPYMVFNIEHQDDNLIPELKKLTKSRFDLDSTLSAANDLKYTYEIKKLIAEEWDSPSEEFVRLFAKRLYTRPITQNVLTWFTDVVKRAMDHFMDDTINDRLKSVLSSSRGHEKEEEEVESTPEEAIKNDDNGIITTQDEWEGYYIIKSILREHLDPNRITLKDRKAYCNVLLDNNTRKPLFRMHFNRAKKYIGLFDNNKKEDKIPVETINDIYKHAERLKATVKMYESNTVLELEQNL